MLYKTWLTNMTLFKSQMPRIFTNINKLRPRCALKTKLKYRDMAVTGRTCIFYAFYLYYYMHCRTQMQRHYYI